VATINTIGRKPIQVGGFFILTILFCVIGFGFHVIPTRGLFALYCPCNFFHNFGPNTTTFIVPGEVFPTRYRSTAYGISAASGKVGAIIAQALLGPLRNKGGTNAWLNHVMEIFALFMYISDPVQCLIFRFVGIFTSLLIPETKRKTLEQLTGEDEYYNEADTSLNGHHSGSLPDGNSVDKNEKAV
jgi:MFS transporter, PHS family, inorganic phosphate transporter